MRAFNFVVLVVTLALPTSGCLFWSTAADDGGMADAGLDDDGGSIDHDAGDGGDGDDGGVVVNDGGVDDGGVVVNDGGVDDGGVVVNDGGVVVNDGGVVVVNDGGVVVVNDGGVVVVNDGGPIVHQTFGSCVLGSTFEAPQISGAHPAFASDDDVIWVSGRFPADSCFDLGLPSSQSVRVKIGPVPLRRLRVDLDAIRELGVLAYGDDGYTLNGVNVPGRLSTFAPSIGIGGPFFEQTGAARSIRALDGNSSNAIAHLVTDGFIYLVTRDGGLWQATRHADDTHAAFELKDSTVRPNFPGFGAAVVHAGNRVYIIGGSGSLTEEAPTVNEFTSDRIYVVTDRGGGDIALTQSPMTLGSKRAAPAAILLGNEILVTGGGDESEYDRILLNPDGTISEVISSPAPQGSELFTEGTGGIMELVGDVVLFGGATNQPNIVQIPVTQETTASELMTLGANAVFAATNDRIHATSIVLNEKLLVIGGLRNGIAAAGVTQLADGAPPDEVLPQSFEWASPFIVGNRLYHSGFGTNSGMQVLLTDETTIEGIAEVGDIGLRTAGPTCAAIGQQIVIIADSGTTASVVRFNLSTLSSTDSSLGVFYAPGGVLGFESNSRGHWVGGEGHDGVRSFNGTSGLLLDPQPFTDTFPDGEFERGAFIGRDTPPFVTWKGRPHGGPPNEPTEYFYILRPSQGTISPSGPYPSDNNEHHQGMGLAVLGLFDVLIGGSGSPDSFSPNDAISFSNNFGQTSQDIPNFGFRDDVSLALLGRRLLMTGYVDTVGDVVQAPLWVNVSGEGDSRPTFTIEQAPEIDLPSGFAVANNCFVQVGDAAYFIGGANAANERTSKIYRGTVVTRSGP